MRELGTWCVLSGVLKEIKSKIMETITYFTQVDKGCPKAEYIDIKNKKCIKTMILYILIL